MPDTPAAATPPLGPLLMACARQLDEIAQAQVNREVGMRLARPGLMRLVPYLDETGIRPTELARRADVSKQAVGQTLRACEELGVVRFDPDPEDGRAYLVRLTPLGLRAARYGESVLAFLESELATRVGHATIQELGRALFAVQGVLNEWGEGDAPSRVVDPAELPVRARRPR